MDVSGPNTRDQPFLYTGNTSTLGHASRLYTTQSSQARLDSIVTVYTAAGPIGIRATIRLYGLPI